MKLIHNNKLHFSIFISFLFFSSIASFTIFKKYFLNPGFNADEYYLNNIYNFDNVTIETITFVPSQLYVFFASLINLFLCNPKIATRLVSFLSLIFILSYFIFKIRKLNVRKEIKVQFFLILFFVLSLIRQPFIGTSDFLAYFFLVIFIIELNEIFFQEIQLTRKKTFWLSLFLALSIVTRPTVLVILIVYLFCLVCFFRTKIFNFKLVFLIPIFSLFFIGLFNFGPLINNRSLVLDIKEVPKDIGTSWLERNYLMAKFWDEGKIPQTKWLSSDEVLEYKRQNPSAYIPKSNLDLLFNEPKLYCKQMIRMFISANYTMILYINIFYFIAIYIVLKQYNQKQSFFNFNNSFILIDEKKIMFTLLLFCLSVLFFSFLAFKLFEFRWVIPVMIVMIWNVFMSLTKLKVSMIKIILTAFYLLFTISILKGYKIFLIS